MTQTIELSRLLPHPQNSNRMRDDRLGKLRNHIEQCGRYEPLIVRPHPSESDCFEVINGHHRLKVLTTLGHASAQCIIWDVDDRTTRLYLATLNRLSGEDVPERRALLLESLIDDFGIEGLASLLPEDSSYLESIKEAMQLEIPMPDDLGDVEFADGGVPVILDFALTEEEVSIVNRALDKAMNENRAKPSRGAALVRIAHAYLDQDSRACPE